MGKINWNFWGAIIAALITGGLSVLASVLPLYIKTKEEINHLSATIEQRDATIGKLNILLKDRDRNPEPIIVRPAPLNGKLGSATFGDFRIEPTDGLVGNISEGTIMFEFNVTNIREDRTSYLSTRRASLIAEDNLTREAFAAQLSNSEVAKPNSSTRPVRTFQNQAMKAYIKFRAVEKVATVNVISFYIDRQEIKYQGVFQVSWNE